MNIYLYRSHAGGTYVSEEDYPYDELLLLTKETFDV